MDRSLRSAALASALLLLCGSADAVEGPDPGSEFTRPGWYAAAMFRYQQENFSLLTRDDLPVTGDTDGSAGASLHGGYRINDYLGVEIQAEWLHDWFEDSLELGSGWLAGANVRAIYPLPWLDKRIQPLAIVGLYYFNAALPDDLDDVLNGESSRRSSFAIRAGFGSEFYVTKHLGVLIDGTYVTPISGDLRKYPFASIGGGFFYRF